MIMKSHCKFARSDSYSMEYKERITQYRIVLVGYAKLFKKTVYLIEDKMALCLLWLLILTRYYILNKTESHTKRTGDEAITRDP